MTRLPLSLLVVHLGVAAAALAQSQPAAGVRVWSANDSTRIAIEMTADFTWSADRAPNPERLFFDVRGARPRFFLRGEQTIPVGDSLVQRMRVARWQPGVFRIVLDVTDVVSYSASHLTAPDRLIVEVRRASGIAPSPLPAVLPPQAAAPRTSAVATVRKTRRLFVPPKHRTALVVRLPDFYAPPVRLPEPVYLSLTLDPTNARQRAANALPAALAAKSSSAGEMSMTRALGLKVRRVVIDAGHGGHDAGTIGPSGFQEKDLVLDLGKRLGELVEKRLGAQVIYTRSDDTFVELRERTRIANEHRADLFISIHANSSPSSSASGIETYYLNATTDKAALEVAARENAASDYSLYEMRSILELVLKNEKIDESRQFAAQVQNTLWSFSARNNSRSKDRGVKKAPFVVLVGARMPSILCEVGFLSNPRDEATLKKAEYRQKLAEALYKGLSGYASTLSHVQVATRQ